MLVTCYTDTGERHGGPAGGVPCPRLLVVALPHTGAEARLAQAVVARREGSSSHPAVHTVTSF